MTARRNTVRLAALLGLLAAAVSAACEPPPDSSYDDEELATSKKKTEPADAGRGAPEEDAAPAPDAGPKKVECTVTFAKDVLPALDAAGCGATQCHGTRFGRAIRIEVKDADLTYGELTTLKLGDKKYVTPGSTDPNASAMHCHLAGKCGVKMPPGGGVVPPALVSAVERWLSCGAPNN